MKNILSLITLLSLALIGFGFQTTKIKNERTKTVHLNIEKSDTIMKLVNLEEFQNEFSNQSFLKKTKNEIENLDLTFNLSNPGLFRFSCLKPQTASIIIYITPGDTITYKLDDKNSIVFKGNNAAQYNFFKKLNDLGFYYPIYSEKEGVWEYKKSSELIYQKKKSFLEQYIKKEKVSDSFAKKMNEVLKFEYINWLLNRFMLPEGVINNYSKYLNGISIKMFNRNDQQDNAFFHLALTNYLHIASKIKETSETYSKENLEYELNLINKNLFGIIREYAITKTLFEYDDHLRSENSSLLQKTINIYSPQIKEKKYKAVLEQIMQRIIKLNSQLPEEILNSKLMDVNGNSVTLEEVLKQQGNKIKVIDFWASWCAPCIEEIKKSQQYRVKLIQENNLEFLYFSIDKNPEKWKNKVKELGKFGMDKNQYLIIGTPNSDIASYFNITTVPQYVILDQTNKMFLINAPSPNDNLQFNSIINQIILK